MWLRTTVNYEYRYGGGMMNVSDEMMMEMMMLEMYTRLSR